MTCAEFIDWILDCIEGPIIFVDWLIDKLSRFVADLLEE